MIPGGRPDARVSVIIPARNEEQNLPACLRATLAQHWTALEVIVVDDHSEDATFRAASGIAAENPRLRVVRSTELPEGWIGKNHALHQGANLAAGEWLLFTDADVVLAPLAVSISLRFAEAHGIDLLSLSPRQRAEGFWERLLQPLVFALLIERFDMREINDPRTPAAAANGQFILVRRAAYHRIGGHEAIRGEVLEDVKLAQRAKRCGLRIYFANTRSLAEAHMYQGLMEIWRGWTKNLFDLLGASPRRAWRTALGELFLWVLPCATFPVARGLSTYNTLWDPLAVISGGIAVACVVGSDAYLRRITGGFPGYAPLSPLGKLVLAAMIVTSWYRRAVRGRIVWKGRTYRA